MQILGLEDRQASVDAGLGATPDAAAMLVAGMCGGLRYPSSACATCMDQRCCNEAKLCAGEPACEESSECLAPCTDDACRVRCAQFYSSPDTLLGLRACRTQQCADACGSTCGEFTTPVPSCQACRQASCCTPGTACAANADCTELDLCLATCSPNGGLCASDCESNHAAGAPAHDVLSRCVDQCSSSCPVGQSWECLSNLPPWPKPKTVGDITFSLTLEDFGTESPLVGAMVKACAKLDYACAMPIQQVQSGIDGKVQFKVPTGLGGFDGFLDVKGGQFADSHSPSYPALVYLLPFIIADGYRGRTQILSVDELQTLAGGAGVELDPARGHFAANAVDCSFAPAPGVSFAVGNAQVGTTDPLTSPFYLVGVPVVGASQATDSSGIGGFLNLQGGVLATVRTSFNGNQVAKVTFVIRAGTVTTTTLLPPVPQ
jgi:hypothetical protein